MLLIREEDVREILTVEMSIRAVEEAYLSLGRGQASNTPRQNLWISDPKSIKLAAGGFIQRDYMGVTAYSGGYGKKGSGPSSTLLYDSKNGSLLALIESRFLSWYRTGATSAVATKWLARKTDADHLALIGTGRQAVTQLLAIREIMHPARITVHSRTAEGRQRFATEMAKSLGQPVFAVDQARECIADADVVVTITNSKVPVLQRGWLREGVHINAMGSHYPSATEIDSETVLSSRVFVDSREQALLEKGEILIPITQGRATEGIICAELGDVVAGKAEGRTSNAQLTLFCSGGLAIEQVAIAASVYEEAVERGLGKELSGGHEGQAP